MKEALEIIAFILVIFSYLVIKQSVEYAKAIERMQYISVVQNADFGKANQFCVGKNGFGIEAFKCTVDVLSTGKTVETSISEHK